MTPDELSFLAAIVENPADDTHRLVFADWLRDRDLPGDADPASRSPCRPPCSAPAGRSPSAGRPSG